MMLNPYTAEVKVYKALTNINLFQDGGGSVYRSPRAVRPQLGLGAVTRPSTAKSRVQQAAQRPGQEQQDCAGEELQSKIYCC